MKAGCDTYLYKIDPDSHLGSQASICGKQIQFTHRISILGRNKVDGGVDGGLVKQIVILLGYRDQESWAPCQKAVTHSLS